MYFDGSEQARAMIDLSVRMYFEDDLIEATHCISDVFVYKKTFDPQFVHSQLGVKLCRGFWAVGCRNKTGEAEWEVTAKNYAEAAGSDCRGQRNVEVPPWNVFEWLYHAKDGRGPLHEVSQAKRYEWALESNESDLLTSPLPREKG